MYVIFDKVLVPTHGSCMIMVFTCMNYRQVALRKRIDVAPEGIGFSALVRQIVPLG